MALSVACESERCGGVYLGPDTRCNFSCNVARNKIFCGCHTMQFVARNDAKVELDSTSATVAHNVARKVAPCARTFSHHILESKAIMIYKTLHEMTPEYLTSNYVSRDL